MPCTVLVGAQWGDEGKGKIIDVLTEQSDWIVRYQGGNNAGHTVEVGADRYVLHLLPSGILHAGKMCVIGNGVVVDPCALLEEIQQLAPRGVNPAGRLFISDRAHLVFPYHRLLDEYSEIKKARGAQIGTTRRGIGPAYGDKAARFGLRAGDLRQKDFAALLAARIVEKNRILEALGAPPLDTPKVVAQLEAVARALAPFIVDTIPLLNAAIVQGARILFEGAQGTLLDIDFGTYPFVTSSNATAGGACTGAGVPPNRIDRVLGVLKAYTTRVGEGPFPTELTDGAGEQLRKTGHEFGATTGRPRRCGWFDAVVARYAVMVNGINAWALTKLDVLDAFETIRVAVAYECEGRRLETIPADARQLEKCRPVYEEWPGWRCETRGARSFNALPPAAQRYLRRIEELTGVPVGILSVGPGRASTMILKEGLASA